ncbi:hypothetical protein GW17_00016804 [Ensete ventricosum]|nr:hypothetical protein GW17_00016804 [Ensete ventricosum]
MQRCYALLAVASARSHVLFPTGDCPCGLAMPPRTATGSAGPPTGAMPIGRRRCRWVLRCRSPLLQAPCCKRPPLRVAAWRPWPQSTAPLQVARPWLATLFPHCLHCENAARTRRTALRDVISSHVV